VSRIAGIVLAAGMSRRLGRPKQLLQLGGRPIIRHVVETALASSLDEVIVVLGARAGDVRDALSGLPARFVVNHRYAEGQGTSLAAGIAALPDDIDAVVVLLGDQPGVTAEAIDLVIAARRKQGASIAMAAYDDGRGHPALFGREHFGELRQLSGDVGGREIIRAHPGDVVAVRVDGPIPADVDTDEDWRALQRGNQALEHRLRGKSPIAALPSEPSTRGNTMDFSQAIREHMPVVGSDSRDVGMVDGLAEPEMIKLTKDEEGNHHWIPLAWVTRVDESVHLDRPGRQVIKEWSDSSPKALEEPQ
jgi:molybdenum cofactor cytidylyltransferase